MSNPEIVSRDEWLTKRRELLLEEKAFNRERDALSAKRRSLPIVRIEEDYRFDSESGEVSFRDLFGPHEQLIVQHFMFGPDWEEGCPSCSFWADSFSGTQMHLAARNTAFVAVSNAPLEKLLGYRKRLGWTFDWVSAHNSNFNADFGVSKYADGSSAPDAYNYSKEMHMDELPGISVFVKLPDGTIGHSYSTYARGLDMLNSTYHLLDLTPLGRDEEALEFSMSWVRRNDQYG